MLEQTLELLGQREPCSALLAVLQGVPIETPADHRGGPSVDMFQLALTDGEATQVLAVVSAAAASGATTAGTRSRGLGGFVEAWEEYARFLQSRAAQQ